MAAGLFALAACAGIASFALGWCKVYGGYVRPVDQVGHRPVAFGFAALAVVGAVLAVSPADGRRLTPSYLLVIAVAALILVGYAWFDLSSEPARAVRSLAAQYAAFRGFPYPVALRDIRFLMETGNVQVDFGSGIYVAFFAAAIALGATSLGLVRARPTAH
jgi:hypothetical protein